MISKESIPQSYVAFRELNLCSNTLRNVRVPIKVNGFPVLLIGGNGRLRAWLAAPLNKEATQWRFIVFGDVISHSSISLVINDGLLTASYLQTVLVEVEKVSEEKAIVRQLDLRPLGLAIYGDTTGLHVSGATLSSNTFENVDTMIAIGN